MKLIKEEKKNIFVISDSMIKNIACSGISMNHNVKIRPHPGANPVDMIVYKPDIIILPCGTSDITNDVNTIKKMKNLVKEIEENDSLMRIIVSR